MKSYTFGTFKENTYILSGYLQNYANETYVGSISSSLTEPNMIFKDDTSLTTPVSLSTCMPITIPNWCNTTKIDINCSVYKLSGSSSQEDSTYGDITINWITNKVTGILTVFISLNPTGAIGVCFLNTDVNTNYSITTGSTENLATDLKLNTQFYATQTSSLKKILTLPNPIFYNNTPTYQPRFVKYTITNSTTIMV